MKHQDLRRIALYLTPSLLLGMTALTIGILSRPAPSTSVTPMLPALSALPGLDALRFPSLPTRPAEPAPSRAARWLEASAPNHCKPFVIEWRHPTDASPAPQIFSLETAVDLDDIRTAAAVRWTIGPAVLFLPHPEASAPDKVEAAQVSVTRDASGSYTASLPDFDTGGWLTQLRAAGRPAPAQPMLIAFATCREGR